MKSSFPRIVKALALAIFLAAAITLSHSEVRADPVVFSTLGCFGAGCTPANSATLVGSNTATIVFLSQSSTTVDTSTPSGFTIEDLGTLQLGGVGTFSATPFRLQVNQTVPSLNSGVFGGTLSGTLIVNGSDVRIVFNQTSLVLGNITYQLNNLTNGNTLLLNSPATGGTTRVSASISAAPVPEPATMLLLGTGLAGIAAKVRQRRKASKEG